MSNFPRNKDDAFRAIAYFPSLKTHLDFPEDITNDDFAIRSTAKEIWDQPRDKTLKCLVSDYFCLSHYSGLEDLSLAEWALQLWRRRYINSTARSVNEYVNSQSNEGTDKYMHDVMRYIWETHLFTILQKPVARLEEYKGIISLTDSEGYAGRLGIHSMRFGDIYSIAKTFMQDKSFDRYHELQKKNNLEPEESVEENDLYRRPIDTKERILERIQPYFHLEVNLSFSDQQLVEDFTEHLAHIRKTTGIEPQRKKQYSSSKFRSLIDHRVLQYLDLRLMDYYVNNEYTLQHHELADIIFPVTDLSYEDVDTVEKLRKSTIRYAEEMTDKSNLNALFAQAKCNAAFI